MPLAGAVLQWLARAWHAQDLSTQAAENIVWKCAHDLPRIGCGPRSVAPFLSSWKALQQDWPELPLATKDFPPPKLSNRYAALAQAMQIQSFMPSRSGNEDKETSPCCNHFHQSVQSLFPGRRTVMGCVCGQHCPACFLGHWSFKWPQSAVGHITGLQCHESAATKQASIEKREKDCTEVFSHTSPSFAARQDRARQQQVAKLYLCPVPRFKTYWYRQGFRCERGSNKAELKASVPQSLAAELSTLHPHCACHTANGKLATGFAVGPRPNLASTHTISHLLSAWYGLDTCRSLQKHTPLIHEWKSRGEAADLCRQARFD